MKKIIALTALLCAGVMAGTLKDSRDGQTYKTVKIGNQVWMAENLNYKTGESKCYDNKESNCKKYGRLYTWEAAKMACPSGWHLPSKEELESLFATVGPSEAEVSRNLRVRSWKNGADKFGFSALPAGVGPYGSDDEMFLDLGVSAVFWSSEEDRNDYAYYLSIGDRSVGVGSEKRASVISVRCLQD